MINYDLVYYKCYFILQSRRYDTRTTIFSPEGWWDVTMHGVYDMPQVVYIVLVND